MFGNNRRSDYLVAMYALRERARNAARLGSDLRCDTACRVWRWKDSNVVIASCTIMVCRKRLIADSPAPRTRSAFHPPSLLRTDRCRPPGAAAPIDDARAPLRVERP